VASEGRGAQESATQRKQAAQQVYAARQDGGDVTEFYSPLHLWRAFDGTIHTPIPIITKPKSMT
jgi:hypothetical protein